MRVVQLGRARVVEVGQRALLQVRLGRAGRVQPCIVQFDGISTVTSQRTETALA